jgi:nitrogen regulatory protein P-II 1
MLLYQSENAMKLIVAYIQPDKLGDVKRALYKAQVYKMSVANAQGYGMYAGACAPFRRADADLQNKIRLEIAVNEDYVKSTLDAIVSGARTGKIGDGKIFVLTLNECIRIRTIGDEVVC